MSIVVTIEVLIFGTILLLKLEKQNKHKVSIQQTKGI